MTTPASHDDAQPQPRPPPAWRMILSGACACLIGIGLARFAYTPLLPAVIAAGWFDADAATYLAAANLGGYLLGVLVAGPMTARRPPIAALRIMMAASALSLFACAVPVSFAWFFTWRLISGVSGGVIMILAAPTILVHLTPSRRGLASGFIFMGVGLGVAASGTLVPLLLRDSLPTAWIGLGIASAILTLAAWTGWPSAPAGSPAPPLRRRARRNPRLWLLHAGYGLNAVGLVPHMVFLSVFVAHGLGQGIDAGAFYWIVFGLGAVVGPLLSGHLADRAGYRAALRLVLLLEALATLAPAITNAPAALIASSLFMGAATPGIVPLVLGRVHELAGPGLAAQKAAWRMATTAFAAAQAVAAYGLAYLLGRTNGDYALLFMTGAGALVLALLIDLVGGVALRRRQPTMPAG
ncbi:YbfB/YjiJ family MFS transporter [uncultured Phenylobacterium sp.]|uniref:YbfB/YjiJ family MFS transporter n=1 Tax=uncultured Phenylobacterium sp. TaxID=349273 RepID=UPI0025D562E3|nr:YbfB/YjiJ family MFS transporter [uncultured Phenylobacterium sp.]